MKPKVRLHIDRSRLGDLIELDQYFAVAYEDDAREMANILAHFVIDDNGNMLPFDEGRKLLGKLTLNEFKLAKEAFIRGAEDAVVPPPSEAS